MRTHFDFYGYCSPTDGKYYLGDEEYFYGEDFRNVKRYKEYKEVGFNILLLQHENSYSGEDFETSACRKCMTEGYKAGLDRIVVSDTRLKALCEEKILIGKNGKFRTEEEFLKYLDFCTKPYRTQPGFFGVQLFDEPPYWKLESYGKVCRGLKKLFPDIYLQCNLLNLIVPAWLQENEADHKKAYKSYLNKFLDESGMDYLLTDEYPFRRNNVISEFSVPVYQVMAEVCKARNVEFRMVFQSFSQVHFILNEKGLIEGGFAWRRVMEEDMYWQINLAMGFGCREYSFFTYFSKPRLSIRPNDIITDGVEGAAFINKDGSRTRLYHFTKKIIREVKKFEPVLMKYRFGNSYFVFEKGKSANDFNQVKLADIRENCPVRVEISRDVAIVTQLRAENSAMYMIENIGNLKDYIADPKKMRVKISLGANARGVKIYKKGAEVKRAITDGNFTELLGCGEAVFIEIAD